MTELTKGRFAIVIGYLEDQNAPSRPDDKLLFVPDDPAKRDAVVRKAFEDAFGGEGWPEPDMEIIIKEDMGGSYGDLMVSCETSWLFLTYVDLPERP